MEGIVLFTIEKTWPTYVCIYLCIYLFVSTRPIFSLHIKKKLREGGRG